MNDVASQQNDWPPKHAPVAVK